MVKLWVDVKDLKMVPCLDVRRVELMEDRTAEWKESWKGLCLVDRMVYWTIEWMGKQRVATMGLRTVVYLGRHWVD